VKSNDKRAAVKPKRGWQIRRAQRFGRASMAAGLNREDL
jgi:hypothetical protein